MSKNNNSPGHKDIVALRRDVPLTKTGAPVSGKMADGATICFLLATSLLAVIGIFDLLNAAKTAVGDPAWLGFYDEIWWPQRPTSSSASSARAIASGLKTAYVSSARGGIGCAGQQILSAPHNSHFWTVGLGTANFGIFQDQGAACRSTQMPKPAKPSA